MIEEIFNYFGARKLVAHDDNDRRFALSLSLSLYRWPLPVVVVVVISSLLQPLHLREPFLRRLPVLFLPLILHLLARNVS